MICGSPEISLSFEFELSTYYKNPEKRNRGLMVSWSPQKGEQAVFNKHSHFNMFLNDFKGSCKTEVCSKDCKILSLPSKCKLCIY